MNRLAHLQSVHGAKIMKTSISSTYLCFLRPSNLGKNVNGLNEHFINDKLIVVKGVSPNGCISYFKVLDNNRMQPHAIDYNYFQHARNAQVIVLAKMGKKWLLDPYPSISYMCDMMWLYTEEPVARLLWDPGGWF